MWASWGPPWVNLCGVEGTERHQPGKERQKNLLYCVMETISLYKLQPGGLMLGVPAQSWQRFDTKPLPEPVQLRGVCTVLPTAIMGNKWGKN